MLISVVMPSYNESKYIKRSLEALRNVGVDEIIVIDGGSKDSTVSIAKQYADIVESSPSYDSPAKARNLGIKISRGDVIAFVDADTVVARGWLEAIRNGFRDGIVGVTGPAYPLEDISFASLVSYIISYDILVRFTLSIGRPHFLGFNVAYRRDILNRIGGFREDVAISEDALLSMSAYKIGKLRFLPDMVVYTSIRRVKERGMSESLFYLIYNGLLVTLFEKPFKVYPKISDT